MSRVPTPTQRPPRGRSHLRDSANFWVALGAAVLLASSISLGIGVARTPHNETLWSGGWFIAGAAAFSLGVLMLLWALVLFLAHRHAESHMCPNPDAHQAPRAETGGTFQPVQLIVTDHGESDALLKRMGAREFEHLEPPSEGEADDEPGQAAETGSN